MVNVTLAPALLLTRWFHVLRIPTDFGRFELFRKLTFAVIGITNIQSTVLSASECTAAIRLAFK